MIYGLTDILALSERGRSCIAAFNVFGFEDAHAVVNAAEKCKKPVILMANRDAIVHMGAPLMAQIMRHEAQRASVPVCIHLDHAQDVSVIQNAIDSGFTSVMIDASGHPYQKNVEITRQVVEMAHPSIGVEAEIGSVGYSDLGTASVYTDPQEALSFLKDTEVDALAIAMGTVHRMEMQKACLNFDLLDTIVKTTDVPIVIHGSTGVSDADLQKLVRHGVQKINLGTALRMIFGQALRHQMEDDPDIFDRIKLFQRCMQEVQKKAEEKIQLIS